MDRTWVRICEECGKEFIAYAPNGKVCSAECAKARKARKRRESAKLERNPQVRHCPTCGKTFMPLRSDQRYCCNRHSRITRRQYFEEEAKAKEGILPTVKNVCPRDCRFIDKLNANGDLYCNYGQIAYEEGLTKNPCRGGSALDCTVYEPGKRKLHNKFVLPQRNDWSDWT